jgi:hypothetical protein
MGSSDKFVLGEWNAICDTCGFKFKASKLRDTWDGWKVCEKCWEPRHPQDFVRGKVDKQRVPWTSPDTPTSYEATTTKTTAGVVGDRTLTVVSAGSIAQYMPIGFQTDKIAQDTSGITGDNVTSTGYVIHWTVVVSLATLAVTFLDPLPYAVAIGNAVYVMYNTDEYIDIGDVTVASLG